MSLCVASAGSVLTLLAGSFSLSWTHSVEKTIWIEHWRVHENKLVLARASVQGSGAGIDLPPDAVWHGDHWSFVPRLPPLLRLNLAASGATAGGWQLCADGACQELGAAAEAEVSIWATQSTCEMRDASR
jgi:hypothetical protein